MIKKYFAKTSLFLIFTLVFPSFIIAEGFIENKGQFLSNVIAKKNVFGGALFIEKAKLTYCFYNEEHLKKFHNKVSEESNIDLHAYSVDFINANKNIETQLLDKSFFFENYFLGQPNLWAKNVAHFNTVMQKNIYDGIDLIFYNNSESIKYDLIVKANSNPNDIIMKYAGHNRISINNRNLIVTTSVNTVTELKPYAYQLIDNDTVEVVCNYSLRKNKLRFEFPNGYNQNIDLIIDPTLIFSTYSGSISDNFGYTATYDSQGHLYSGSTAFGVDYPITTGAFQQSFQGGITDIVVTKYDTLGQTRIYSTYLGGSSDELPHSMVVNNNNELYILGTTGSNDFPTTSNAFQTNFNGGTNFFPSGLGVSFPDGSDMFISRLNIDGGALLSSSFLGGSDNDGLNTSSKLKFNYADEIRGEIDIDLDNNIYIASTTFSNDFPTTANSFAQSLKGNQDGCIVKMDYQLSTIIWSSFLGGSKDDAIYSLELDSEKNIYVTGGTNSSDFPTTPSSYDATYNDSLNADAFISIIEKEGSNLINSTYFGSNKYDQAYFIELNESNQVYVLGQTKADSMTLIHNSNLYVAKGGQFISVFDLGLSNLLKSTRIGTGKGTPDISPTAFLVDKCNKIYLSGWGSNLGGPLSTLNLPVTDSAFQTITDGNDFYLAVYNEQIDSLEYATYFGGSQSTEHVDGGTSRFDKNGVVYQSVCAGCGGNNDFPIYPNPGAVSTTNNSPNCNNAVFKFDFKRPIVIAEFSAPTISCTTSVSFINNTSFSNSTGLNYFWDFGDGASSSQTNPTHQYQNTGVYNVSLISTSPLACNFSDTITKTIYILSGTTDTLENIVKCKYNYAQIGLSSVIDSSLNFSWYPSISLNNPSISNPYTTADSTTNYQLIVSGNQCSDTLFQKVIVNNLGINLSNDTSYCFEPIMLIASSNSNFDEIVWSSSNDFTDTLSQQANYLTSQALTYYVKISDSLCYAKDSVSVLSDLIDISLIADTISCLTDTITINAINNVPNNPIINYNWLSPNPILYTEDSSTINIITTSSNWHAVEVINDVGCFIKDSIYINTYPKPAIDSIWASNYSIPNGSNTELNILTTDSIFWFNGMNELSIIITPTISKWHNVTVSNGFCLTEDSIYIEVREVFCNEDSIVFPSGFTPNYDETNDNYRLKNKGIDVVDFIISIYNRLGQRVYTSNDINFNWNGRHKGKELPPQVFHYYCEILCSGGKKLFKKGNITLIK